MVRFSIVIPAWNAEATLAETLDAILAQTSANWECMVVDDGSTDGTLRLAESYAGRDGRFRVVSQANRGTAGAYNTGLEATAGEWIVICSADDLLLPKHISCIERHVLRNPSCDIFSSNGYLQFSDGTRQLRYSDWWASSERDWSMEDLIEACFFGVGACYRRGLFDAVGGYSTDCYGEDYDFWLRAVARGYKAHYVPDVLGVHRVAISQRSADQKRVLRSDITSITRLRDSGLLSPEQRRAAKRTIRRRQWLLLGLASPRMVKAALRPIRSALLRMVAR